MDVPQSEPTVETKLVYQGRVLKLRVDTVRMSGGRMATREIVEHPNSICVVPVDTDGTVVLVRQYRKPTERVLLEVPAGRVEAGEVSNEAVLREMQEETGLTAGNLRHLASFWLAPGWATEFMHAYLATNLRPASLEPDEDEDISVVRLPLAQVPELIQSGEIQDAKSIAALLLSLRLLDHS